MRFTLRSSAATLRRGPAYRNKAVLRRPTIVHSGKPRSVEWKMIRHSRFILKPRMPETLGRRKNAGNRVNALEGGILVLESQSRFVTVNGSQVHYLIEGQEGGRPVVMLHGASFSAATWKRIGTMRALAEAGFEVVAVDLPGYGESEPSRTAPENWLHSLLDALGISRPVIVAPSMSGQYALPLVTGEPARVAAFVAVAPVCLMQYRDRLPRIAVPVLAVWGEKDRLIPQEQADMLVQSVKRGQKVVITGGSHAPYTSDPETFHKVLLTFLAEVE